MTFSEIQMKYLIFLWLVGSGFLNTMYAAGVPFFSHETFDHIGVPAAPPALTNSAADH